MESIRKTIGHLRKDELLKNGTIMFISGIIAGFFNYIYQVYMGRALGPEDYGVFGALFAIFYMIGIISQTLGTSTTQFVSKFVGEGKEISSFIKGCLKRTILFGSAISIIFLIFSSALMKVLKLSDIIPILILILILALSWINPIMDGTLRGMKRFSSLSFVTISNTGSKMVIGIVLVMAGFGVSGALFGVAAGTIVGLLISFGFLKEKLRSNNNDSVFRYSKFYSYSLPVMFAMIGISIPSNLDVIMANYFFSPIEAGLYMSVSVLGKIIFFFSAAVGTVMFPMITEKCTQGQNSKGILKKSILYAIFLSGSLVSLFVFYPRILVTIFGDKYFNAISMVAPYVMAMFFFSITTIFISYHLAIRNNRYIAFFSAFSIIEIALLLKFHSSMDEMINVLLIGNLAFLVISIIYTFKNYPLERIHSKKIGFVGGIE